MYLVINQFKRPGIVIAICYNYPGIIFVYSDFEFFIFCNGINIFPVNNHLYFKQAEYPAFLHCKYNMILTGNKLLFK